MVVGEHPTTARLVVTHPADRRDLDCLCTTASVLLRSDRQLVIDLSDAGPATVDLLQAIARIASQVDDPERLLLRRPDRTTCQFLRLRRLDAFVVVQA